jgi:hypothetical protein
VRFVNTAVTMIAQTERDAAFLSFFLLQVETRRNEQARCFCQDTLWYPQTAFAKTRSGPRCDFVATGWSQWRWWRRYRAERAGRQHNQRAAGQKRHFLRHLYIKCIISPRQARGKHRENSKKSGVSHSWRECSVSAFEFKNGNANRGDCSAVVLAVCVVAFTKTGSGQ